jgi:hypothetical protein
LLSETRAVKIYKERVYTVKKASQMPDTNRLDGLWFLTLYSLYILEVILFAKNNVAAITNGQVHNHLTRNRLDYRQLSHNLEICNSRPVIAG